METLYTEDEQPFLTHAPAEIAHILRSAVQKSALVTAYFGASEFALTSLLEVSPAQDRMVFDLPAQARHAAGIAASRSILFVSSHEGIKVKFQVDGARAVSHDGRPALESRMPQSLLRLQRRENYRVPCPLSQPVVCAVPFTADGSAGVAELVVLDISVGGIALADQHHRLNLRPGMVYPNCIIALPDAGSFATAIEVRGAYEMAMKNGLLTLRAGCRFVSPPRAGLALVQRYAMKLERGRNARFG